MELKVNLLISSSKIDLLDVRLFIEKISRKCYKYKYLLLLLDCNLQNSKAKNIFYIEDTNIINKSGLYFLQNPIYGA